ncbi:MAG: hypothetical protein IJB27_04470 [Clostridia bacterium]|nr:hypothetical protein [Clostridia bacterium]
MYRHLMEFIEHEGSYPKSRCILQCVLHVPLVLFGTVALWANPVGVVLFWVLSVPLFFLPIYRCVHETSYIQRYVLQLVHDAGR